MATIVSKIGIHCLGPKRDGYGAFLTNIAQAGRQLALVKVRDDFGAVDEPLALWSDLITIGAKTEWDDADYNVDVALARLVEAHALNPKIKYWEYFNERNGDYVAQADFYINLLPRLYAEGIGLCMFNCASGTPAYPIDDALPYEEIARACGFARTNGFNAILGLHEYFTDSNTIGRYQMLESYLNARRALIPIAITEYGYEVYGFDNAGYMAEVRQFDPVYMASPNLLGCALWTLGGGGWGESNFQTMLPALGDYIATVAPLEPPPAQEWEFDYWEVDGQRIEGNPMSLTMNSSHIVTPHARPKVQPPTQTLTLNACPEYAGLVVQVTPPDMIYPTGTVVTCEAILT